MAEDLGTRIAHAVTEATKAGGVMCESYHDIWMKLHEDLIVLQRIDRTEEGGYQHRRP